jgi:hypothetical protein
MLTKQCSKCNETKELVLFPKQSARKDGLSAYCKVCTVKETQKRQKTLEGLVKKIYHNQRMTSGKMGRALPNYTEKELYCWMMSHNYFPMWQTWVNSNYDKWLSPSIDRINNQLSYTLDNIQLTTWKENLKNQKKMNISGEYIHSKSKAVDQYSMDDKYIQSHESIANASRAMLGTRGSVSNITGVCTGKLKSAYGFKWKFKNIC